MFRRYCILLTIIFCALACSDPLIVNRKSCDKSEAHEACSLDVSLDFELTNATDISFLPGSDDALIAQKNGQVVWVTLKDASTWQRKTTFTIPDVFFELDCGLISVRPDPGFLNNSMVYAAKCDSVTQSGVYRFTLKSIDEPVADLVEIIVANEPAATKPWHNVGTISFDSDGNLITAFGDKTIAAHGQDPTNIFGSLIRITPSRSATQGGYTIPAGNAGLATPEIFAYGLRSPWKSYAYPGDFFVVGDVGAATTEEVNITNAAGTNFGWATHEGPCGARCGDTTGPIAAYGREFDDPYLSDDPDLDPASLHAIWVAPPYDNIDGPYDAFFQNKIIFGDYCAGFARTLTLDADGTVLEDRHLMHAPFATAWGVSPAGHIYFASFGTCDATAAVPGEIRRLELNNIS